MKYGTRIVTKSNSSTVNDQTYEDFLINDKEVAKQLALGRSTVQQWRLKGYGPIFCKIGRSVRYRQSDVRAFIQNREYFSSTSAADERRRS